GSGENVPNNWGFGTKTPGFGPKKTRSGRKTPGSGPNELRSEPENQQAPGTPATAVVFEPFLQHGRLDFTHEVAGFISEERGGDVKDGVVEAADVQDVRTVRRR